VVSHVLQCAKAGTRRTPRSAPAPGQPGRWSGNGHGSPLAFRFQLVRVCATGSSFGTTPPARRPAPGRRPACATEARSPPPRARGVHRAVSHQGVDWSRRRASASLAARLTISDRCARPDRPRSAECHLAAPCPRWTARAAGCTLLRPPRGRPRTVTAHGGGPRPGWPGTARSPPEPLQRSPPVVASSPRCPCELAWLSSLCPVWRCPYRASGRDPLVPCAETRIRVTPRPAATHKVVHRPPRCSHPHTTPPGHAPPGRVRPRITHCRSVRGSSGSVRESGKRSRPAPRSTYPESGECALLELALITAAVLHRPEHRPGRGSGAVRPPPSPCVRSAG